MVKHLLSAIGAIMLAATVAAQTTTPAPAKDTKDKDKEKNLPLVLNGCVTSPAPGTFAVEDEKKGRFQLTGRKLDVYIGKRVEVQGRQESGLHITTGLYPSPNAAAQAGQDPVRDAQAQLPGSPDRATSNVPLPKVTVTQVKTVKGDCK
jgi:hypothetical protein